MLAVKGRLLFDGRNAELIEDPVVLIRDGRIVEVGRQGELTVPFEAEVHDFPDACLMPGLIDLHVHLSSCGEADPRNSYGDPEATLALRAGENARRHLEAGFTTVRSMGAKFDVDIKLRKAIASGILKGPRVIASGRCLTMTGGHGHQGGLEVDGPWAVRQGVRTLLKLGADVIKLMATGGVLTEGVEPGAAQLSLEELQAGVLEAHNAGKRTATHAQGATGIRQAVQAGIDSVEHGCFLEDDVIAAMVERQTALVPTLSAPRYIIEQGVEAGIPTYAVEKTKRIAEAHCQSVAKAYAAGVPIGLGTDAGTPFNYHGRSACELLWLAEAGLTEVDALRAATSTAAAILGRSDLGSLQTGCWADLLAVSGNPLEDLSILSEKSNLQAVFLGGKLV